MHAGWSCGCLLQVLCWGVRDMKRFQLLQVTSPLVEFECGGVSVKSKPIKNTKDNPNFPDPVLSFDVVSGRKTTLVSPAVNTLLPSLNVALSLSLSLSLSSHV